MVLQQDRSLQVRGWRLRHAPEPVRQAVQSVGAPEHVRTAPDLRRGDKAGQGLDRS
ncbi:hypothetical protein KVA01_04590 [Kocuria varians]|uniref:Uncharacterized protein n=1 Tax=Kocuria varians TaxID=1272 RepID=A0A4Y4D3K9_KOCVA|nr:hypothetical protein KVA01_04590 [Kocuria varians]